MSNYFDHSAAATADQIRAAADPATAAATLAEIAWSYPELRVAIARNPATYKELLDWLGQFGSPEVKSAVAARALESAIPPLAPAPGAPTGAPALADKPINTFALLALIFGLGGGALGIVFGHLALRQIRRTGERGARLALVGLVVGYLVSFAIIFAFLAALDLDARLFSYCSSLCY